VKNRLSQYLAEFIGTYFMVFFGCGSMIMAETLPGYSSSAVPVIWGGAVSIMIYAVGHISGAHFNPAVTIAFWATRKLPGPRLPGYLFSQLSGALLASMTHLLIFGSGHHFGMTSPSIALLPTFLIEVIASFSLMFVIMSVATDSRAVGELAGIAIGSTVAINAFVVGPLTGASMNPARSFSPAIFSGSTESLWIYLTAPIIGAITGAFVYNWIKCDSKEESDSTGCC